MDKLPNSAYPPIVLKSRIFTYFDVLNKNMTMKIHGNDIFKIKRTKKNKTKPKRGGTGVQNIEDYESSKLRK